MCQLCNAKGKKGAQKETIFFLFNISRPMIACDLMSKQKIYLFLNKHIIEQWDQLNNHWTEIFGINSNKTMAETNIVNGLLHLKVNG